MSNFEDNLIKTEGEFITNPIWLPSVKTKNSKIQLCTLLWNDPIENPRWPPKWPMLMTKKSTTLSNSSQFIQNMVSTKVFANLYAQ